MDKYKIAKAVSIIFFVLIEALGTLKAQDNINKQISVGLQVGVPIGISMEYLYS
jgi:L-cystine uptake protein TcyP (sodium:dicarboxylate symporter family)